MWKKLLTAGALVLGGQAANSATVLATYTGTVFDSRDYSGIFHGGAEDIHANNGRWFTLAFTFDTDQGNRDDQSPIYDEVRGGSYVGAPDPLVSAVLEIDGLSQIIRGELSSGLAAGTDYYRSYAEDAKVVRTTDPDLRDGDQSFQYNQTYGGVIANAGDLIFSGMPGDLDEPFSLDLSGYGIFGIYQFSTLSCPQDATSTISCNFSSLATGYLLFESLDVIVNGKSSDGPLAPVPLPASGMLLLVTIGGIAGRSWLLKQRKATA